MTFFGILRSKNPQFSDHSGRRPRLPSIVIGCAAVFLVTTSVNPVPSRPDSAGETTRPSYSFDSSSTDTSSTTSSGTESWEQSTGGKEIFAIAASYPKVIEEYGHRNGDWALRIGDTWFYWANARLLPEYAREDYKQYQSIRFYSYTLELPPVPQLTPAQAEALNARVAESEQNPPKRHEGFLGALYDAETRRDTELNLERVEFLGFSFRVHTRIVEPLSRVEREVRELIKTDTESVEFVSTLYSIETYSWRSIAGMRSRSYHSYGVAIDFVPRTYDGRFPYWRWAYTAGIHEWWAIDYENRWMVPAPIVSAFENHGFVWGGKWLFFDTMHFEYRPEILLLTKLQAANSIRR